jgi:hypothetical protein
MLDADITMSVTIDGFVAVARLITISTNETTYGFSSRIDVF